MGDLEIVDESKLEDLVEDEATTINEDVGLLELGRATTTIYEGRVERLHRGVRNCQRQEINLRDQAVEAFADGKTKQIGRRPDKYGWRSYTARTRSGRKPWPSNARYCSIKVIVECYAVYF